MLPNIGDIIILTTYTRGLNMPEKHDLMMILGESKEYGSQYRDCYIIKTGEKKTFAINHNSDIKIIQNANPAAANIVSILA